MPTFVIAYVASAVLMLAADAVWLGLAVPRIYRPMLGSLLSDKPNLAVAAVFYLVYVVGIVTLVVLPAVAARSWLQAIGAGALLGLVAYGTYDFTNLATLRGWPTTLSLIDVAWGMALTAFAAVAGYLAVVWLSPAS